MRIGRELGEKIITLIYTAHLLPLPLCSSASTEYFARQADLISSLADKHPLGLQRAVSGRTTLTQLSR